MSKREIIYKKIISEPTQNAVASSSTLLLQRATGAAAKESPGGVIPGESLHGCEESHASESYELAILGNRAVAIAHPSPLKATPSYAAITDYLSVSFKLNLTRRSINTIIKDFASVAGSHFLQTANRGKGLNGYEHSYLIGKDGAMFCYGGQRETALFIIPGKACHTIGDWKALVTFFRDELAARITRWDGAVDDYDGVHSVDDAVEQYLADKFTNGGNKPSCKQAGNWISPDGSGRTFYVGKRQNGKMLRVYEKGMQLGRKFDPWVRYEVELRNVDRVVPWDVLEAPGKYVAGAYPKALNWIQDEMSRIKTVQKEEKLSYDHLVKYGSIAYGRLMNVMLEVEGSPEKVLERLRKEGLPKRLQLPKVAKEVK